MSVMEVKREIKIHPRIMGKIRRSPLSSWMKRWQVHSLLGPIHQLLHGKKLKDVDDEMEHKETGMDADKDKEIILPHLMERKGQDMFGVTRLLHQLGVSRHAPKKKGD